MEDRLIYYQLMNILSKEVPVSEWVDEIPYLKGLLYMFRQSDTKRNVAKHRLDSLISKCEVKFSANTLENVSSLTNRIYYLFKTITFDFC